MRTCIVQSNSYGNLLTSCSFVCKEMHVELHSSFVRLMQASHVAGNSVQPSSHMLQNILENSISFSTKAHVVSHKNEMCEYIV